MRNSIIRQKSYFCREIENMKSRFLRTLLLSVFVAAFCVNAVAKDFVLVIDAGHGGKDVGAVGDYAMEKDVNLGVALKFGELVKKHCKNVKVVYTRDADFSFHCRTGQI